MNKIPWLKAIGSTTAMLLVAGSCLADPGPQSNVWDKWWDNRPAAAKQGDKAPWYKWWDSRPAAAKQGDKTPKAPTMKPPIIKTPEIDAGAGGAALALLVGGLLLTAEKRRRS